MKNKEREINPTELNHSKGSNRDGIFTIDKQTGIVSVANPNDLKYDEYHLCALAR